MKTQGHRTIASVMGPDLTSLLEKLGVVFEYSSKPVVMPGVIQWLGRISEVNPEQMKNGLAEGMEVWTSGQGFAPIDLPSVESWLFDAPRGSHLLLAERKINFDKINAPKREGRELVIWTRNEIATFIGLSILDGTIELLESDVTESINYVESDEFILEKPGIKVLKPINDFSALEEAGLNVALAKPVLLPAKVHRVTGMLKGPEEIKIERIVINCGGLHIISNLQLLPRTPMLNRFDLEIETEPDFSILLSERRIHSEGLGDLLHWWRFDNDSAVVDTYDVLVPAHKGLEVNEKSWILDGVSSKLHRNL